MSQTPTNPDNLVNLKLVTMQEEVRLDVVELLEDYLALAQSGQLVSVAIVALKSTDNVCYGFSAVRGKVSMLGAADMLKNLIREDIRAHCTTGLDEGEEDQPES